VTHDSHVGELLAPVGELLDNARLLLTVGAGIVLLVVAGAKLERYLMKRQLEVLDGAEGDVDRREAADGGRA
jgi:hypothetical protein